MRITSLQNSFLRGFATQASGSARNAAQASAPVSLLPDPVPNRSDILFNALFTNRNDSALKSSGPIASLRAHDAIRLLSIRTPSPQVSKTQNIDASSRFRQIKITRLGELADSLVALKTQVGALREPGALNIKSARSSDPDRIRAAAGADAPLTRTEVIPTRLAAGEVLVSDEQENRALGLAGSFFINGNKVTVESGDSLHSIRNKINFGEDRNNNGTLDGAEDVNENGVLDSYGVSGNEFGGSLFVIEDQNGNGAIDASEDTNANGRLDGGILQTRVIAGIQGNRLTLTSVAGGDTRIDLRDDDNVLLGLGFFERDRKGISVQKETQFDAGNPPANLNREPQTARIEVDGKSQTNRSNTFDDVIEDTALTVKQVSDQKVRIDVLLEASQTVAQIETLFDRFNSSIRKVNDLLTGSKTFAGDAGIQKIRNDLTGTPLKQTRDRNARNQNIDRVRGSRENQRQIGFEAQNTGKNRVDEVTLSSISNAIGNKSAVAFQTTGRDLLKRLNSIGIRTLDDDTLAVDSTKLKRALTVNHQEVLDLFDNPETGILPVLEKSLSGILQKDTGVIALKQREFSAERDISLNRNVRAFAASFQIDQVSNLLAVV